LGYKKSIFKPITKNRKADYQSNHSHNTILSLNSNKRNILQTNNYNEIIHLRSTTSSNARSSLEIEIEPDSGIVAPNDFLMINLSFSASSDVITGTRTKRIIINSNDPIDSLLIIPITIEIPDIIPPNPPENLTATPEYGYISLAWDAPEAGLHKYNI
jgi:hypothetical protein